jgi:hypothetical protein
MAYTVERVTREIGDLQLSINRMLTDLSQQLREESGKLAEIRLAIDTENSRLKELHDIDGAMVSLKAILEVRPSAAQFLRLRSTSEKPIFKPPSKRSTKSGTGSRLITTQGRKRPGSAKRRSMHTSFR